MAGSLLALLELVAFAGILVLFSKMGPIVDLTVTAAANLQPAFEEIN